MPAMLAPVVTSSFTLPGPDVSMRTRSGFASNVGMCVADVSSGSTAGGFGSGVSMPGSRNGRATPGKTAAAGLCCC